MKNSELKNGESLVVDIKGKDAGLTINDKTIDQIFSDAKVLEFMNAMAQIELDVIPAKAGIQHKAR